MAREIIKQLVNMDNADNKRRVIGSVGALSGWYEVELKPRRDTRSLRQNGWYWSCICPALAQFLEDQDYECCSVDFCHALLKAKFLSREVCDPRTGEVLARAAGSTANLTTEQFSVYCERCRAWLADFFNIYVPDPESDAERRTAVTRRTASTAA